ncbi:hypothetical protein LTS18_010537 [Coniosporium uncinatum]|uniref:Uncharacterized protein n=1 Tax=Coniosporium uncinatum TaxID=93489 RepID=A0ACC3CZB6_9PEZI|nr:hypothetical protein LTS18_010537 [Coniosporium uncinatum]
MIERLGGDAKLAAALNLSAPVPASASASLAVSTSTSTPTTTTSVTAAVKEAAAMAVPPVSPSKPLPNPLRQNPVTAAGDDDTTTPTGTASRALSPTKHGEHQHRRQQSELSGPKLVLAQNNPHLKSHRRRQSAMVSTGTGEKEQVDERKMPGYVEKGMEHQGVLADVLWGRWVEGLRVRWPLA